jgi:hypothetical protein
MKKTIIILFTSFLLLSCGKEDLTVALKSLSDGLNKLEWLSIAKSDNKSQGRSLYYDSSSNVYTIGQFSGTLSFDPNVSLDTFTSPGTYSMILTKYNKDGVYLWSKAFGDAGTSYTRPKDVRVDSSGNIIILGDFNGTIDADPGVGTQTLTSNGSQDLVIIKLDSNGDYVAGLAIGNTGYDESEGLEVDSLGNIYYVGTIQTRGVDTDFDPTGGTDNLTGFGSYDVFVTKLNSNNTYAWTYYIGGTGSEWGGGVDIDASGNVYFSCKYSLTIDLDPAAPTQNVTAIGVADVFLVKMNSSGVYQDSMSIGGDLDDYIYDIHVDTNGDVLMAGSHKSTNFDFDPSGASFNKATVGSNDLYFAKYDSSFNLLWANSLGSVESERLHAIEVGSDGSVYVAGYFSGAFDADPGAGVTNLTPSITGIADGLILKFDTNGLYSGSYGFGGSLADQIYDLKIIDGKVTAIGGFTSPNLKFGGVSSSLYSATNTEDSFTIQFGE